MNPSEREFFVEALDGTRLYTHVRVASSDLVPSPFASSTDAAPSQTTHGKRPTLVLCDGLCCDGFIYKYLWDDLAPLGQVAHFHYRGHGRSELPQDPARIDVSALAQDLLAVIDHLETDRVVLFGHSLGTQVALEAYRQRPELIRGLVLICGSFGRVTHTFKGSNLLATASPDTAPH